MSRTTTVDDQLVGAWHCSFALPQPFRPAARKLLPEAIEVIGPVPSKSLVGLVTERRLEFPLRAFAEILQLTQNPKTKPVGS